MTGWARCIAICAAALGPVVILFRLPLWTRYRPAAPSERGTWLTR